MGGKIHLNKTIVFFAILILATIVIVSNVSAVQEGEQIQPKKLIKRQTSPAQSDYVNIIITFNKEVSVNEKGINALSPRAENIKKMPLKVEHKLPIINGITAKVHKDEIETIRNLPYVKDVEIDSLKFHILLDDTVPLIKANYSQSYGYNGSGVKVCIIDTGIDFFHSNLPTPVASKDFTDWDWYIDGQASTAGASKSYKYYLNISNSSLDWLEIGASWVCNSTSDLYYDVATETWKNCTGGDRYDIYIYYPNGTLADDSLTVPTTKDSESGFYWVRLNLTNVNGNNGSWVIMINETDINQTGDYPTIVWGSNVSHNLYVGWTLGNNPVQSDSRAFYNIHPQDDNGHGTHVAGIIASNNTTYKGVAPGVDLYIAKVLDTDGSGTSTSIVNGIEWCVSQGVDIISMSLGGTTPHTYGCNDSDAIAVDNASAQGVLCVIAAGNNGTYGSGTIASPGCARTALTVGATDKVDATTVPPYSGKGPTNDPYPRLKPEIVAPGGEGIGTPSLRQIMSTYITNRFEHLYGTSMATPHVAGAAALLLQKYSTLTPGKIKVILMNSANQAGTTFGDLNNTWGAGLLDVLEAANNTYVLNDTITNNTIKSYTIEVSSDVKATIYWEETANNFHNSINLSLANPSGTVVDTSTNTSWVTQQVGYENPTSGKWKVYVGGVNVNSSKEFYLATNQFAYPSTILKLLSPSNGSAFNTSDVTLSYFVTAENLDSCMIWIGNGTNWQVNLTNSTPTNNATNNFTQTFSEGTYTWNIECNGTFQGTSFSDFNETNYTFSIDTQPPIVTINTPIANANLSGTVTLNWTIDDLTFEQVWYSLDGGANITLTGKSNSTNISISTEGSHTMILYANDSFGRISSQTVSFTIDKTPPVLNVILPLNTTIANKNNTFLNYTISDNVTSVESVLYSLDGQANISLPKVDTNTTISFEYPGKHILIIYANDSAGNSISKNVTFVSNFDMNMSDWVDYANTTLTEVNSISVSNGTDVTNEASLDVNTTLNLTVHTTNFNITLENFNGLNVVWKQLFSITENNTTVENTIELGSGTNITKMIYLGNVQNFLENNRYNATVEFSPNSTNYTELYYCGKDNPSSVSECNLLIACTGNFNGTPCYKDTPTTTIVYVPHMSSVAAGQNTIPPTIDIVSPTNSTYTDGDVIYTLKADITTPLDTTYCNYSLKGVDTSSGSKTVISGSTNYTWTIGPLHNGNYNLTFWCEDKHGYNNSTIIYFTIDDTTGPTIYNYGETNKTLDSAVITWSTTEPANERVDYGLSCTNLNDYERNTLYSKEHAVELTGLSSGTTYYYKITSCDYQNNCNVKSCSTSTSFLTAWEEGDTSSNEGAEGGGGGGNTTQVLKQIHFWTLIEPNKETIFDITSSAIVVDELIFILSEGVVDAQMSVESYGSTTPAGLPTAPNFVYQYFDISSTFTDKIKLLKIQFKIPSSWFTNNHYDPNEVKLYHYKNNEWQMVFTSYEGMSGDYYVYESEVTSLSKFAVSTVEAPPYEETCGNGICNQTVGETCSNCQEDCGPCPVQNETYENATNEYYNNTNKTTTNLDFSKLKQKIIENKYVIVGAISLAGIILCLYLSEIKPPKVIEKLRSIKNKFKFKKRDNFELEPGIFKLK